VFQHNKEPEPETHAITADLDSKSKKLYRLSKVTSVKKYQKNHENKIKESAFSKK